MELLIKRILLFLFITTIFFVCCNKNEKVEKEDSPDFYELCFYFSNLPSNAVLNDVETAAVSYSQTLSKNGINVLSRKSTLSKSCWFLDKEPDFSDDQAGNTQNEVANYLLKAFFKKESSSLYGIKNSGKRKSTMKRALQINFPLQKLMKKGFHSKAGMQKCSTFRTILKISE